MFLISYTDSHNDRRRSRPSLRILTPTEMHKGTAVAQWLRCCATDRKDAGWIPAGVSGFFIDIKSFRSHYGTGVDSAFLGVKAAGA
jgi:hypothetical protein